MSLLPQQLVGHRIGVLWPEHASYFLGHVTAYSQEASSSIPSGTLAQTSPLRSIMQHLVSDKLSVTTCHDPTTASSAEQHLSERLPTQNCEV